MNKILATLGVVAALAVGAVFVMSNNDAPAPLPSEGTVLAQANDFTYETFTEDKFNKLKGTQPFSVFVHSSSCGSCAKKNKQLITEANQFNKGVVLKLEYSEAPQSFLQEYGVTKYDSFVHFDKDGKGTFVKGDSVENTRNFLK